MNLASTHKSIAIVVSHHLVCALFLSFFILFISSFPGSLLFDEDLQCQIYVKQIWVQDRRKVKDLLVGVNFKESVHALLLLIILLLLSLLLLSLLLLFACCC